MAKQPGQGTTWGEVAPSTDEQRLSVQEKWEDWTVHLSRWVRGVCGRVESIGRKPDIVGMGAGSRVVCLMVRCLAGFRW